MCIEKIQKKNHRVKKWRNYTWLLLLSPDTLYSINASRHGQKMQS